MPARTPAGKLQRGNFLGSLLFDLRYAVRLLRKSPGFTAITVLLLAVGIGANTAIFSALDTLLLRPLAGVKDAEELVLIMQVRPNASPRSVFWHSFYRELKKRSTTMSQVAGQTDLNLAVGDGATVELVRGHVVTGEFFSTLGVQALHGRVLTPEDEWRASDTLPVVLSYRFWQRRFRGDPAVVGQTLLVQGHRFVVVGVLPKSFNGTSVETSPELRIPLIAANVVIPADADEVQGIDRLIFQVFGRLKPGATPQQAQAECASLWRALTEAELAGRPGQPGSSREWELSSRIEAQPIARGVSVLRREYSTALALLMASVGLLLLMVCASVAGLLLARCAARRQELALRMAIGATRGGLFRQMLVEGALLAALGGAGGVVVAFASLSLLVFALPPIRTPDAISLPLSIALEPDLRILSFLLAICVVTVLVFGLAPALAAARININSSIRAARFGRGWRSRQALVTIQVALCTMLLVNAGLLIDTFRRLRHVDAGFDRDHVVTFSLSPGMLRYSGAQQLSLQQRLMERTQSLPGVRATAVASRVVMRGGSLRATVAPAGQTPAPNDFLNTSYNTVSPRYFETMGMRVVAGRTFTGGEAEGRQLRPIVVNEAFARRFFPGIDPIGRHVGIGTGTAAKPEFEIIGVTSDAKYRSLREAPPPTMYHLWTLHPKYSISFNFHVRTHGRPEAAIQPVREILREIDPQLPFFEIRTLAEEIETSLWSERLLAALALLFAVVAAVLAAFGIYGLLSYAVTQRTREIGIRMALGANRANILSLISLQTLAMASAGLVLGLLASFGAAPLVGRLLYGVAPSDPTAFSLAVLLVAVVAAAATVLPAWRAVRVEPAVALRQET
ncbi:MAG: ABC transporter permease [Bryobacteraceae bacterium]